jgi:hypothetical protein
MGSRAQSEHAQVQGDENVETGVNVRLRMQENP